MAYLMIEDFAAGIDLRKSAVTAPAGTLRMLRNGYISPGGEIFKRKTLTQIGSLPPGLTRGLAFSGRYLRVFGTAAPSAVTPLPDHVLYEQLVPSDPVTITRVLDVQLFQNKLYVVARMSDDSVRHFYDGQEVTDTNAKGFSVRAYKSKLFAVDGVNLRFSGVLNATDWTTATGAGIIDTTTEDAGNIDLLAMEEYFGSLALFGRTGIQIWDLDPDPAASRLRQTLGNTGLVTPGAVTRFGSGDVLFLADTGIRSLRARDVTSAAAVNDLGAAVDTLVARKRLTMTAAEAERITAIVDPLTGHFWLAWGDEALVLADYPGSKISAWALFDFNVTIDQIVRAGSRIAIRSGDELFIYGSLPPATVNPFDPNTPIGLPEQVYDATPVEITTPFLDAGRPAAEKDWTAIDVSCQGTWDVYVSPAFPPSLTSAMSSVTDPPPVWTQIGTVSGPTWDRKRVPIDMRGTHIALRMVSQGTGFASIASVALHHRLGEET